jgi:predicted RNA-binding protein YlxR (DUF448 family)
MGTTKKIPLRQCIGCGQQKPKKEMIRVIKTPEDELLIDTTGKKNGRGAYICSSGECLEKAIKNKGLERSLKTAISKDIYEKLKEEMT